VVRPERKLPSDWVVRSSFFWHAKSGCCMTSFPPQVNGGKWENVDPLLFGWKRIQAPQTDTCFYWNPSLNTLQWTFPVGEESFRYLVPETPFEMKSSDAAQKSSLQSTTLGGVAKLDSSHGGSKAKIAADEEDDGQPVLALRLAANSAASKSNFPASRPKPAALFQQ